MTTYPFDETLFNEAFQCVIYNIMYDYKAKEGTVIMGETSCCSMSECVDLFLRIDPEVRKIKTFAGTTIDTIYQLNAANEWFAY